MEELFEFFYSLVESSFVLWRSGVLPPFTQLSLLHDFLLYRQGACVRVRRGERGWGRVPGCLLYCLDKVVHVVFNVLCSF